MANDSLGGGSGLLAGSDVSSPGLGVVVCCPVNILGGDVGCEGRVKCASGRGVVVEVVLSLEGGSTGFGGKIGGGGGFGGDLLLLFALNLFRITVEEHIGHDVPAVGAVAGLTSESEDLSAEEPPEETDGLDGLVVAGDGNVDVAKGCIGVTEGNDGDVDIRGLANGLVVDSGVSDDDDSGLPEGSGDVVGERSGSESAGNGAGTGVGGEFEDSSVAEGSAREDTDCCRVLYGCEDPGGEDELLPGLAEVEEMNTVSSTLIYIVFHGLLAVLGSYVDLGGEHLGDVVLGCIEDARELVDGRHAVGRGNERCRCQNFWPVKRVA